VLLNGELENVTVWHLTSHTRDWL